VGCGLLSAAPAVAAAGPINAPLVRVANATSSNWSGFASTSGPFTSVSASWVQPKGSCTSKTTYSSFWVGIDGDGSDSVEQTGSEVDCNGGSPVYYAWYEMYPAYPVNYSESVTPGDHFTASVTASGSSFTLKISDTTKGWTKTQVKTSNTAQDYSAEIIAEAPSSNSGVLPLTDFGTVSFTGAKANGSAIGSSSPQKITMETGSGTVKAQPTSLTGGEAFKVTWHHS
jgi:hypothetical protein